MDEAAAQWLERLKLFAPEFLSQHPSLQRVSEHGDWVLHGSTTFGVVDAVSDLDIWVLAPSAEVLELDRVSPTRFFEFTLDAKKGHFTVEPIEQFHQRVRGCDFPLIAELRHAISLNCCSKALEDLIANARRPMRDDVQRAWFCYHYVEMRGEHRACDNPIDRGDPIALLIAMTKAAEHALRAACVLDNEPYHYSKWLARMAVKGATGAIISRLVNDLIAQLANDGLRAAGPEAQHPLSIKLREIRAALIAASRAAGIDEAWLTEWWLHIDKAKSGIERVNW